ncbi:MAG: hypothetical protein HC888_03195 [Candidatus Competibacteraceae bacterium]|nr:hypothetical protein [Candidatus Competibacteraceae bacterium]
MINRKALQAGNLPTNQPTGERRMTIQDHLRAHFADASNIAPNDQLAIATWEAKRDVIHKLEEIREGAAWLIRDLQALIERIDRDAIDAVVLSTGITGSLATRIDLGGAELAALKTRLKTLEMLKG